MDRTGTGGGGGVDLGLLPRQRGGCCRTVIVSLRGVSRTCPDGGRASRPPSCRYGVVSVYYTLSDAFPAAWSKLALCGAVTRNRAASLDTVTQQFTLSITSARQHRDGFARSRQVLEEYLLAFWLRHFLTAVSGGVYPSPVEETITQGDRNSLNVLLKWWRPTLVRPPASTELCPLRSPSPGSASTCWFA